MADNADPLTTWVVEIATTGADKAKADAQAVADAVKQQDENTQKLSRKGRAYLEEVRRVRKEHDQLIRGQRDGTYLLLRRRQEELKVSRQQTELDARRRDVLNGNYARQLRTARELTKEREKVERAERRTSYQQRYGRRLGGFLAAHGDQVATAGRAGMGLGTAALAGGSALAGRGFTNLGGTVEWNRFQLEADLASRAFADKFKPSLDEATNKLRELRLELDRMSPSNSSRLENVGLAAGGFLGANFLARQFTGMGIGGLASAGVRGAGALGGVGAAGFARLGLLAPAAYVGARFIDKPGIDPNSAYYRANVKALAERAPQYAHLRTAEEFEKAAKEQRKKEFGGLNFLQRRLGGIGFEVMEGLGLDMRGKRNSPLPLSDLLEQEAKRRRGEKPSKLTNAGAGFEETGSAYYRLSSELSLRDTSLSGKSERDILELMYRELQRITGNTQTPPPALSRP